MGIEVVCRQVTSLRVTTVDGADKEITMLIVIKSVVFFLPPSFQIVSLFQPFLTNGATAMARIGTLVTHSFTATGLLPVMIFDLSVEIGCQA